MVIIECCDIYPNIMKAASVRTNGNENNLDKKALRVEMKTEEVEEPNNRVWPWLLP